MDDEDRGLQRGWAVVLGCAQDGGVPQLGCRCPRCQEARIKGRVHAASLAVITHDDHRTYRLVIDTGPDFRVQYEKVLDELAIRNDALGRALRVPRDGRKPVDSVLLTHLHMGHLVGLLELGMEVVDGREIELFCTQSVARFIQENAPWSQLVERRNVVPRVIGAGESLQPASGLTLQIYPVPHRNEHGDTIGLRIALQGGKSLLYIPDADHWQGMEPSLIAMVDAADYALLDGTFFHGDELGTRDQSRVPHPPVAETAKLLADRASGVFFTHLNHTNPLLDPTSHQRRCLEEKGFSVAFSGQVLDLNPVS